MPVTNMELFFDLVYVFAFTQLSEALYERLSWLSSLEVGILFLAVWWAWDYTAWATGWIDPDRGPVVLMLSVCMLLTLGMAGSVPRAFDPGVGRGELFALAYVALQLLRSGFMVAALDRGRDAVMRRNYVQLLAWSALTGIGWLAGGLVHDPHLRVAIWLATAIVDLAAPLHGFWLPGRGGTQMSDWSLAGAHLAERCQLILMIAFGEIVLRLGEAFTTEHEDLSVDVAFVIGFVLIFALWATYFVHQAERSAAQIHQAEDDAARLGRSGYTYGHMLMVAGVILVAVGMHKAVELPGHRVDFGFAAALAGGPLLYLCGIAISKVVLRHGRVMPPLSAGVALVALTAVLSGTSRLVELVAAAAVAAALSVWAERDRRRGLHPS